MLTQFYGYSNSNALDDGTDFKMGEIVPLPYIFFLHGAIGPLVCSHYHICYFNISEINFHCFES